MFSNNSTASEHCNYLPTYHHADKRTHPIDKHRVWIWFLIKHYRLLFRRVKYCCCASISAELNWSAIRFYMALTKSVCTIWGVCFDFKGNAIVCWETFRLMLLDRAIVYRLMKVDLTPESSKGWYQWVGGTFNEIILWRKGAETDRNGRPKTNQCCLFNRIWVLIAQLLGNGSVKWVLGKH